MKFLRRIFNLLITVILLAVISACTIQSGGNLFNNKKYNLTTKEDLFDAINDDEYMNNIMTSSIVQDDLSSFLIGDVNGDGIINTVDALMTAQYTVGNPVPGFIIEAADVNGDGLATIVDAMIIAQYDTGSITQFPINDLLIKNSSFNSTLHWNLVENNGALADFTVESKSAKIEVSNGGTHYSDLEINQKNIKLEQNINYQLSFKAKSDSPVDLYARVKFDSYSKLIEKYSLSTEIAEYKINFEIPQTAEYVLYFEFGGVGVNTLYFDDINIEVSSLNLLKDDGDYYLLGGDILLAKNDPNHQNIINAFKTGEVSTVEDVNTRAVKRTFVAKWPNNTVPYYLSGNFSEQELERLSRAMRTLEMTCNIKFVKTGLDLFHYKIMKTLQGPPRSSLGFNITPIFYFTNNLSYKSILHELIHGLGFSHEHQRYDRDEYITVDENIIRQDWLYAYEKIPEKIFNVLKYSETFGEYDYESIMHYGQYGNSISGIDLIITTKDPYWQDKIGTFKKLSDKDIIALKEVYPGNPGPEKPILSASDGNNWYPYKIELSWSKMYEGFGETYEVYRSAYHDGPYKLIAEVELDDNISRQNICYSDDFTDLLKANPDIMYAYYYKIRVKSYCGSIMSEFSQPAHGYVTYNSGRNPPLSR